MLLNSFITFMIAGTTITFNIYNFFIYKKLQKNGLAIDIQPVLIEKKSELNNLPIIKLQIALYKATIILSAIVTIDLFIIVVNQFIGVIKDILELVFIVVIFISLAILTFSSYKVIGEFINIKYIISDAKGI